MHKLNKKVGRIQPYISKMTLSDEVGRDDCHFKGVNQKSHMGVSKNRGIPKMDGENNGKPYFLMDDLGGKPTIFGNTRFSTSFHMGRGGKTSLAQIIRSGIAHFLQCSYKFLWRTNVFGQVTTTTWGFVCLGFVFFNKRHANRNNPMFYRFFDVFCI